MKAMVLAAGRGERMRPLTLATPKPLLEAGGRSLLDWHLGKLARAGIRDVVVNVSWLAPQLIAALGDGSRWGLRIAVSDEGPEPFETAGGIVAALPLLGDAPFAVVNADIWTEFPLPPALPAAGMLAHLVLVPNPPQHPRGDFGLNDGLCLVDALQRHTFSGMATYDPAFFAGLAPGRRPLKPLLDAAMAAGKVSGELYTGRWTDVGTPERLAELRESLSSR